MTATVYHLRPKGRCASCGFRRLLRGDGTLRSHAHAGATCDGSRREPAFDLAEELAELLITWAKDVRTIHDDPMSQCTTRRGT